MTQESPQPPLGATPEPSESEATPTEKFAWALLTTRPPQGVMAYKHAAEMIAAHVAAELTTARAALAQCEEQKANLNEAWKLSNQQLAEQGAARRDEESWWKEKHDYQARAESAEAKLAQREEKLAGYTSDWGKIIGEVLKCNPISACDRADGQLEPPWEVIARVRCERDQATAAHAKAVKDATRQGSTDNA